jgi:hypothetical protein
MVFCVWNCHINVMIKLDYWCRTGAVQYTYLLTIMLLRIHTEGHWNVRVWQIEL